MNHHICNQDIYNLFLIYLLCTLCIIIGFNKFDTRKDMTDIQNHHNNYQDINIEVLLLLINMKDILIYHNYYNQKYIISNFMTHHHRTQSNTYKLILAYHLYNFNNLFHLCKSNIKRDIINKLDYFPNIHRYKNKREDFIFEYCTSNNMYHTHNMLNR